MLKSFRLGRCDEGLSTHFEFRKQEKNSHYSYQSERSLKAKVCDGYLFYFSELPPFIILANKKPAKILIPPFKNRQEKKRRANVPVCSQLAFWNGFGMGYKYDR